MVRSLIKYSLLTLATAGYVAAQDSGEGFVFKCDNPGVFALTFDDGPSEYTGTLLATLKENSIKATFFSVGTQAADASIAKYLKQAYDEGHQIASHTNTHADLNKLSVDQIKKEMQITEEAIKKAAGVVPAMMRPPYGNCNAQCRGVMKEMGYTVVQWSVDSNDWKYMGQPENWDTLVTNVGKVVDASNPQSDSFVSLQHDIHQFSVERTPKVIALIKAKGYKFVTVSECLSNRFSMYKNVANPSGSASVSGSTSTVTPTGSMTSANGTSVTSSATATSASSVSSITTQLSQSTTVSAGSSATHSSTTVQQPKVSSVGQQNSAGTYSPTFIMSLIALYAGYHNNN